MKLSELKTGESGVIVKVSGHGGFRKRIIEMGFIKGKKVEVLLNAPLQDPVKYKIMGYEVSLRHSEADHIEVVSVNDAKNDSELNKADFEGRKQVKDSQIVDSKEADEQALGDKMLVAEKEGRIAVTAAFRRTAVTAPSVRAAVAASSVLASAVTSVSFGTAVGPSSIGPFFS